MAARVEILDGEAWVVFRDLDMVTNRQSRPYTRFFHKMVQGWRPDADADSAYEYASAIAFMLLGDWSLGELPTDWDLFLLFMEDQPSRVTNAVNIAAASHLFELERAETPDPPTKPARKKASRST